MDITNFIKEVLEYSYNKERIAFTVEYIENNKYRIRGTIYSKTGDVQNIEVVYEYKEKESNDFREWYIVMKVDKALTNIFKSKEYIEEDESKMPKV